jgi:hypothetical protein
LKTIRIKSKKIFTILPMIIMHFDASRFSGGRKMERCILQPGKQMENAGYVKCKEYVDTIYVMANISIPDTIDL